MLLRLVEFWNYSVQVWPWFKVTDMRESENVCTNYLTKFWQNLGGIWCAVETCRIDEPRAHFISSDQCSVERTLLRWFSLRKKEKKVKKNKETIRNKKQTNFNSGLQSDIYWPASFILGLMISTSKPDGRIPVWMALTFIQRYKCLWKQNLLRKFSCKFRTPFRFNFVCCHELLACSS